MTRFSQILIVGIVAVALLAGYAFAGVIGMPAPVAAEETGGTDGPARIITVQGEAQITVEPDTAAIMLGIETQESTALAAQQANNRAMNNVVAALKKAGIGENDLATSQFSIHPVYSQEDREPGKTPVVVGYRVSNVLRVRTHKLDQVGALIDAGISAGANQVQGVSFYVQNTKQYESQGLEAAIADARAKAEVIARAAGTSLKGVVTVSEQGVSTYQPQTEYAFHEVAADAATPIFSGDQQVTVRVTVQFAH